mgnify:CR=1 FL=1
MPENKINHTSESNPQRKIRFKISITGIEIEATNYTPEGLTMAIKAFKSGTIWFFVAILVGVLLGKAFELFQSLGQLLIDTS